LIHGVHTTANTATLKIAFCSVTLRPRDASSFTSSIEYLLCTGKPIFLSHVIRAFASVVDDFDEGVECLKLAALCLMPNPTSCPIVAPTTAVMRESWRSIAAGLNPP
jgi:hypothetical protein